MPNVNEHELSLNHGVVSEHDRAFRKPHVPGAEPVQDIDGALVYECQDCKRKAPKTVLFAQSERCQVSPC